MAPGCRPLNAPSRPTSSEATPVPWAVVFKRLSVQLSPAFVFFEMMIFIVVLLVGYIFVWRKGMFDWNRS